jgi:pimeloyl-ACP methyl ester carboxylesterase
MTSRRTKQLALLGTAVAAAGITAGVLAKRRRAEHLEDDPWPELPEGRPLVVPTEDGAHLAVAIAGPPEGPTVVLAHCWMGLRAFWAAVARDLVEDGHRVVVYDQRGHGGSSLGDTPASIENLGNDLRDVLRAVDAHDAVLVGHSMGGMTIQSYAAQHAPDFERRVRGVVLVATAARTVGRAVPLFAVERFLGEGRAEWSRRGAVGRRFVRGAIGERAQRTHIDLTLEGVASAAGAARSGFLVAMAAMDLRPAGRTIGEVPTRVLVGSRDGLTPPRLARQLAEGISGAELEVIPGAGHMLPLEAPGHITDAVRAVATRAPAASTA